MPGAGGFHPVVTFESSTPRKELAILGSVQSSILRNSKRTVIWPLPQSLSNREYRCRVRYRTMFRDQSLLMDLLSPRSITASATNSPAGRMSLIIQPMVHSIFLHYPETPTLKSRRFLHGWSSQASVQSLKAYDEQHATRYSQVFVPPTAYSTPVRISEQPATTTLNMSPLGILECEVVDETGKALPEAIVTMSPFRVTTAGSISLASDSRSIDYLRREAGYSVDEKHRNYSWTRLTNTQGRATIENLPAGQQLVQCSLPGYMMDSNINYIAVSPPLWPMLFPARQRESGSQCRKLRNLTTHLCIISCPDKTETFRHYNCLCSIVTESLLTM